MKRRLMIARALVHEPRLLILDEPTAGVDIEIRRSMWTFLRQINEQGTTIILTTHYLEEAESLCRNIAIIDGGRIIENDSMAGVIRKLNQETFVLNFRGATAAAPALPGFVSRMTDDHTLEIEVTKEQTLNDIFARLSAAGHRGRQHAQQGEPAGGALHAPGRDARAPPARRRADWRRNPSGASAGSACETIIRREYGRIIRIWGQTLVPPAVTAALYFLIFGSLIGRRIGADGRRTTTCSTSRPA